jgi:hypothetical protein
MPWYVGMKPPGSSARSMWPIRDGNHKIVAYAPSKQVAEIVVRLIKDAP